MKRLDSTELNKIAFDLLVLEADVFHDDLSAREALLQLIKLFDGFIGLLQADLLSREEAESKEQRA